MNHENERKQLERFIKNATGIRPESVEQEFTQNGNWANVSGHGLIEAARVCVFAQLLGLDTKLAKDLGLAALLHDGNKKREIEAIQRDMQAGGSGRRASLAATQEYLGELATKGMPQRVLELIGFTGGMPEVLFAVHEILDRPTLTDDDCARLIIHYVDAYTRGDAWVEGATEGVNDVDRRAQKNRNNPNYKKIAEEIEAMFQAKQFFAHLDSFAVMAAISHMIEERISGVIAERSKVYIEPLRLPEEVDARIMADMPAARFA